MRYLLCIPFAFAGRTLLVLFGAAILFQLTVLFGLIPTEMVWGGRLNDTEERTVGAIVSITVLLVAVSVVLIRLRVIGKGFSAVGRWGVWALLLLFSLNTVGNLFALDLRETLIFTPVTLLAAVLSWRLALGDAEK
jgi:hypothetical protein